MTVETDPTTDWNGAWPPPEDWGTWELCEYFNKRVKAFGSSLSSAHVALLDLQNKVALLESKLATHGHQLIQTGNYVPPPPPLATQLSVGSATGVY